MQAGGQRFESVILHPPRFYCGTVFDILAQAKQALLPCVYVREVQNKEKESKGAWWMPRLTEAKKDVVSCEKPRVGANGL